MLENDNGWWGPADQLIDCLTECPLLILHRKKSENRDTPPAPHARPTSLMLLGFVFPGGEMKFKLRKLETLFLARSLRGDAVRSRPRTGWSGSRT